MKSCLPIGRWAAEDRPTYRLENRGVKSLSNCELLSIIIGSWIKDKNAIEIARNILEKYDNDITCLEKVGLNELTSIDGIGKLKACKIMAAIELEKRMKKTSIDSIMDSAVAIYDFMHAKIADLVHEEFWVLLMNQRYKLNKCFMLSKGGLTETSVDIRLILKEALSCNAICLAVCHNHPSGSFTPSKYDDDITEKIRKACDIMRIHFVDHVIITDGSYFSYREYGKL